MHACARGSESLGSEEAQSVKRCNPPLKPCAAVRRAEKGGGGEGRAEKGREGQRRALDGAVEHATHLQLREAADGRSARAGDELEQLLALDDREGGHRAPEPAEDA